MNKVTVYKVIFYDITNDTTFISRRMATKEGALIMKGEIIPESAIEIFESDLEPSCQWTPIGFKRL